MPFLQEEAGLTPTAGLQILSGFTSILQNPQVFPVITTTYTVTVNDGFNNASNFVTVTVNPLPQLFNITGGGEYCSGGAGVPIGLSGSEAGINYQLFMGVNPLEALLPGTDLLFPSETTQRLELIQSLQPILSQPAFQP